MNKSNILFDSVTRQQHLSNTYCVTGLSYCFSKGIEGNTFYINTYIIYIRYSINIILFFNQYIIFKLNKYISPMKVLYPLGKSVNEDIGFLSPRNDSGKRLKPPANWC